MWAVNTASRSRNVAGLVAVAVLAVVAAISLFAVLPPGAQADAPPDHFSAERAFAHVDQVGEEVHVAGQPRAADGARLHRRHADGLGLRPERAGRRRRRRRARRLYAMAHVRNVVAVLPGTDSTGRVFLIAHYDSVQVSYGANDDGAGVATLLETARALTNGPPPRNDIVFVFTDAEEACLCGAEAFVSQHPLAADGGVVLNFEARGANGPVDHVRDHPRQRRRRRRLRRGRARTRSATSFAVEVYRILPNDTDFSPFRDSGRLHRAEHRLHRRLGGLPLARRTRPDYMDLGSLQHHGVQRPGAGPGVRRRRHRRAVAAVRRRRHVLPGVRRAGALPGLVGLAARVLALLAVAGLVVLARRRGLSSVGRGLVAGFGLGLIPLLAGRRCWPSCCGGCWSLIRPGYANMIDPWWPGWFRAGVVALVADRRAHLVRAAAQAVRARGRWPSARSGWLAVLGVVFAAVVPGGSYLAALPALAGGHRRVRLAAAAGRLDAAAGADSRRRRRRRDPGPDRDAVLPGARAGHRRGRGDLRRDAGHGPAAGVRVAVSRRHQGGPGEPLRARGGAGGDHAGGSRGGAGRRRWSGRYPTTRSRRPPTDARRWCCDREAIIAGGGRPRPLSSPVRSR